MGSGKCVVKALREQGFRVRGIDVTPGVATRLTDIDVAFIAMHGKPGEDGTIQALLELLGICYTGSGVAGSAIGMDKILSKAVFRGSAIPTPEHWYGPEFDSAAVIGALGLPVVVKPRAEGSSVGVAIAETPAQLSAAVRRIRPHYPDLFYERYIPGILATCGILHEVPLPILEIAPRKHRFYDYRSKYTKGMTDYVIPARLPESVQRQVQAIALAAHDAIGARGFSRVDFVIDRSGQPYVLEVNTIPGLLPESNLPLEARAIGLSYNELIYEMLKTSQRD